MLKKLVHFLTLFTSMGTLVCCALPALFVTLGMGATLAGALSTFPQLIWLSQNKLAVFLVAALMLSVAGFLQYRARFEPCPVDPDLAKACTRSRRVSLFVYMVSLSIYLIGVFFAFVAPLFMQ